jgi:hypothetical protein
MSGTSTENDDDDDNNDDNELNTVLCRGPVG